MKMIEEDKVGRIHCVILEAIYLVLPVMVVRPALMNGQLSM